MELQYGLEDHLHPVKTMLYGLQWTAVILSSSVFKVLILAEAMGLSIGETQAMMQRTFVFIGLASLVQTYLGHRIAVFETVAAFWLSTCLIITTEGLATGEGISVIMGKIQALYIASGILILLLTALGLTDRLKRLFSPLVMGVALMLVSIQVSGGLLTGMFRQVGDNEASAPLVLFSLGLLMVVLWVSFRGSLIQSIIGLVGIGGGWLVYTLMGLPVRTTESMGIVMLPDFFALGIPIWDASLFPLTFFTVSIYFCNATAAVRAGGEALHMDVTDAALRRSNYAGGVSHIMAAAFSSLALVPAAMASGLTVTTGVGTRRSMVVGCIILGVLGLLGPVGGFFASIPPAVSYSVSLAIFAQLMAIGLLNCMRAAEKSHALAIIGASLLLGTGIMYLPLGIFVSFGFLSGILGNGLFMGVACAIFLENIAILPSS